MRFISIAAAIPKSCAGIKRRGGLQQWCFVYSVTSSFLRIEPRVDSITRIFIFPQIGSTLRIQANDAIDVIDSARDLYIESMPGLVAVAGALVSEARGLVFTSNRGENTVSVFSPHAERDAFKIVVGMKPNGLAFDSARGILIVANVGDPSIPDSHSVSVVDLARRERIAEVKVPGRTRWTIYDAAGEMFFVNIASPARIIAIDARNPTKILKEYEVPAAEI